MIGSSEGSVFTQTPWVGPLLFDNESSDARDHCANERTFLSYLRLSIYMFIVSLAIILSFHLKSGPTELELRMAKPLGIIFWCLGIVCLFVGFGNYIKTVTKYSRRMALVQTGWKTQLGSHIQPQFRFKLIAVIGIWNSSSKHCVCLYIAFGDQFPRE